MRPEPPPLGPSGSIIGYWKPCRAAYGGGRPPRSRHAAGRAQPTAPRGRAQRGAASPPGADGALPPPPPSPSPRCSSPSPGPRGGDANRRGGGGVRDSLELFFGHRQHPGDRLQGLGPQIGGGAGAGCRSGSKVRRAGRELTHSSELGAGTGTSCPEEVGLAARTTSKDGAIGNGPWDA